MRRVGMIRWLSNRLRGLLAKVEEPADTPGQATHLASSIDALAEELRQRPRLSAADARLIEDSIVRAFARSSERSTRYHPILILTLVATLAIVAITLGVVVPPGRVSLAPGPGELEFEIGRPLDIQAATARRLVVLAENVESAVISGVEVTIPTQIAATNCADVVKAVGFGECEGAVAVVPFLDVVGGSIDLRATDVEGLILQAEKTRDGAFDLLRVRAGKSASPTLMYQGAHAIGMVGGPDLVIDGTGGADNVGELLVIRVTRDDAAGMDIQLTGQFTRYGLSAESTRFELTGWNGTLVTNGVPSQLSGDSQLSIRTSRPSILSLGHDYGASNRLEFTAGSTEAVSVAVDGSEMLPTWLSTNDATLPVLAVLLTVGLEVLILGGGFRRRRDPPDTA